MPTEDHGCPQNDFEKSFKPRGTKKAKQQLAELRQDMKEEAERDIMEINRKKIRAEINRNIPTKGGKLDVENNIRFGNVCENEKGEYGVFYRYRGSGSRKWIGINLETNEQWLSLKKPTVLFQTVKEYVEFMVATGHKNDPEVYGDKIT